MEHVVHRTCMFQETAFPKLLFLVNFITCLAHLVTSQSHVNILIVQGYICKNSIQEPNRFNRSTFFNGGSTPFFLGENILDSSTGLRPRGSIVNVRPCIQEKMASFHIPRKKLVFLRTCPSHIEEKLG